MKQKIDPKKNVRKMFSLSVLKQFKVSHERVEGLENSQKNLSGIPFKQFNLSS